MDSFNNNYIIRGIYVDQNTQTVHKNRIKSAFLRENDAFPFNNHSRTPETPNHGQSTPTNETRICPEATQRHTDARSNVSAPGDATHRYNLRNRKVREPNKAEVD